MGHVDVTTVIMAGGLSSRMGTDKSFVPVLGKPMIEHVLDSVRDLGSEEIIITNRPDDYAYLGLPIFSDVFTDVGPLGGLHAALSFATHPYSLIVACDMPWLSRSLLEHLLSLRHTADVVVPRWQKFPEPLHAIYNKACLEPIEANIQAGSLKSISFYGEVKVRFLETEEIARFDPQGRSLTNVNTPEDLVAVNKR